MNNVSIRKFEEKDIKFKIDLINNEENNKYLHYDLPLNYEDTLKWFKNIKDSQSRYDAIIIYNEKKVGIIGLLNIDNKTAEYYITLNTRGKGIAKKASDLLFKYAKENLKLNKLYLYTECKNHRAQSFFEKIDFKKIEKIDARNFTDRKDRYYYVKEI